MKRRSFIQTSSAFSIPVLIGGFQVSSIGKNSMFNLIGADNDKVLVLVQLIGGNDGLNTLIPLDQYDALANVRSNLITPQSNLLSLTPTNSLHPAMTGMKAVFDDGKLGIVQSVGYPNQNRSHFRSTDIWNTASAADEFLSTGWLGRYFDTQYPNYPEGYPNAQYPDPFAITMGSQVSETCQGLSTNFSLALVDPSSLGTLNTGGIDTLPDGCYGEELGFVREVIQQTNAYAERLVETFENGNSLSAKYPDNNRLAQQLKTVATLISGGSNTKVFVVSLGGFDTHANQVVDGEPANGNHAELLQTLADAVCAFQDDLKLLGLEERVLSMTFSEFGRRIRSNNSFGTDHGDAAPMLLFGSCVNAGIIGDNPEISEDVSVQEAVPMQYDFRSMYGSVLMDWFGVEEALVKNLLFDDFQRIPIINDCAPTPTNEIAIEQVEAHAWPNPFSQWSKIKFNSENEHVKISLINSIGHEVRLLTDQQFTAGTHQIAIDGQGLAAGTYFYRIQTEGGQKTKRLVKM